MNDFTLITLRWYHGGVLHFSGRKPVYKGGFVIEFLDVDVDKMSYFELKDYIRKLGYSTSYTFSIKTPNYFILVNVDNDMDIFDMMSSLEDEDVVDVFVNNLVDKPDVVAPTPPKSLFLESVCPGDLEESGASFNVSPNFRVGEDYLNMEDPASSFFPTMSPFNTTPHFTTASTAAAPRAVHQVLLHQLLLQQVMLQ